MSGGDQQIVALFELNNCSVEQIVEITRCEPAAIFACLMSYSPTYRKQQLANNKAELNNKGARPGELTPMEQAQEDITNDEFEQLRQAAMGIALRGDPDSPTTSRMIRFLWNEKKGRNNIKGAITNIKTNVYLINQGILQAREAVQRSLAGQASSSELLEVEEIK